MTGKEAIIDKIIKDARKIANNTSEEGVQKAQEIIAKAENDSKIYRKKNREEITIEREDIIRKKITVANLEVKKLVLATKQDIIAKAFEQSKEAIRNDKENYKKMLVSMLEYAEDGDILTISEKDKTILTKKLVKEIADKKGIKISYNDNYGNFSGGIILSNKFSDKNFTLEVELNSIRDEIEPQIAQMMFGEGE